MAAGLGPPLTVGGAPYRMDQLVFFTFVMYDRRPQYLRILGPALTVAQAQACQRHAALAAPDAPAPALAFRATQSVCSVAGKPPDALRDAGRWAAGDRAVDRPGRG